MGRPVTFIGFGEAASAFADGLAGPARAYDRKTEEAATAEAKRDDFARYGVQGCASNAEAVKGADLILSLVTAESAPVAARETARAIETGALFCDMNSVAPDTKRAAAEAIEAAGGRYVDVAVMAPVYPAQRNVPLLVSGPHAEAGVEALKALGFSKVRALEGPLGAASAVKMIRSVMIKGLEALTAECFTAAELAGVRAEVTASLNASWPGIDWAEKADYNLDRMMVHGVRRAEEMEEVVKTLQGLGADPRMTRGTVAWQRAVGRHRLTLVEGLDAKLAAVLPIAFEAEPGRAAEDIHEHERKRTA